MYIPLKIVLDNDWDRLASLSGVSGMKRRWSSYFNPRFTPVVLIRIAFCLHRRGWLKFSKVISLMNFLIFNIEVPSRLKIGPGLVIPHPQGTILGGSEIGSNVTIFHQVTLGAKVADFGYDISLRPKICDGVIISAGAKILGSVILEEGCIVGANAVVLNDIPAGKTAVGIPAKIL